MTAAPPPRTPFRCSFAADERGDQMNGTAAPATGMLLVEQPGGWGRRALVQSRLDPVVGRRVGERAVSAGMRVLLIRRPGRSPERRRRRWAVVDCRPGSEGSWWGTYERDEDLLSLPLDGSAGTPSDEPAFLACTHGRHDACCAIRGRPVAQALARARPDQTWECSHVGGDRFAANLVALPHGVYYGRVTEESAADVVAAHARGEVLLPLLRGRSTFAPVEQAAQNHARQVLGDLRINALSPVEVRSLGASTWRVRLEHPANDLWATVTAASHGDAALLTCHAKHETHPPYFEVSDLRRADT